MTNAPTRDNAASALPWPINSAMDIALTTQDARSVEALAASLRQEYPILGSNRIIHKNVGTGWMTGPTVYLEDHRPIELFTEAASRPYEYRMLGLADDGDIYLISGERDTAFETYMRDIVGLGAPTIVDITEAPEMASHRIAEETRRDAQLIERLSDLARQKGRMNFLSYITTADVWALAAKVAEQSGAAIYVTGPPPELSKLANDKLWFADTVSRLLGRAALPMTCAVYNVVEAALRVKEVAEVSDRVVLKIPSSAGGLGNISLASEDFRMVQLETVTSTLKDHLSALGWRTGDPLLVSEWEETVTKSPSAQLWVPHAGDGLPILEGLFIQAVAGTRGAFVGAERADLPENITEWMAYEAVKIARLMQELGYFGRLSLDAVLLEDDEGRGIIHWIEANARWGGVSIPMTIANRIAGAAAAPPLKIVQRLARDDKPSNMLAALKALDPLLLRKAYSENSGIVFLLPPGGRHILFAAIADTQQSAAQLTDEALGILS